MIAMHYVGTVKAIIETIDKTHKELPPLGKHAGTTEELFQHTLDHLVLETLGYLGTNGAEVNVEAWPESLSVSIVGRDITV
jgi:hypothetical protein